MTKSFGHRIGKVSVLAFCALSIAACAHTFGSAAQPLTVTSDPPGARVYIDGADSGSTPRTLHITRGRAPVFLRVQREGAAPVTQTLSRRVSARGAIADVLLGLSPLPGFAFGGQAAKGVVMGGMLFGVALGVDWHTGALWMLRADSVHMKLPR